MMHRLFRLALKLGVVGSVVAIAAKVLDRRRSATSDWTATTGPWPPLDSSVQQTADAPPVEHNPAALAQDAEGEAIDDPEEVDELLSADRGGTAMWTDPGDDGICPASHPVKAKMSSKVFHLPGMANYERTKADRCYADAASAEADGLRQAKR
ncbi:MAG TPA: hypothetical protein VGV93_07630 [Acidimicrobiales bacterium]|nr:hypothetical protein [Acidimicrobiales bacterium]